MATRFDKTVESVNSTIGGYEGELRPSGFTIPSCGIEDLDVAVFDLFDKQIPLFYDIQGEQRKVPVVFATGERFAILRRKQPLTDKSGALILPLISITRGNIENNPQKGISNNQMFPEVVARRISDKNTEWRQLNNFEGFQHIKHTSVRGKTSYGLRHQVDNNIYETIEVPPVKYFGATYEISVWSSFTQQMNDILTAIMSAYTINPGQQFKIESKKGYWFPAFVESGFSQDSTYSDFTDQERFVKYNMTVNATGFILAPNIPNGKVALKSIISAPTITFETLIGGHNTNPQVQGIAANNPDTQILEHVQNENDSNISQQIGVKPIDTVRQLQDYDKSDAYVVGESDLKPYDFVGERSSKASKTKKVLIKDNDGNISHVKASIQTNGEILYDQKYAEKIFNISNFNK